MPDADVRRSLSLYSIPTPAALAAYIGFALVSFANETAAIVGCIAVLAATAIGGSRLPWLFAVAVIPYSYMFGLHASGSALIATAAIAFAATRMGIDSIHSWRCHPTSAYGLVLTGFIVVVAAHITAFSYIAMEGLGFLACLWIIFFAIRYRFGRDQEWLSWTETWITWSVLVACLISATFVFMPLIWLIAAHPPLDNLRLSGVFDEANAAGRYLLPIFLLFFIRASTGRSQAYFWLLALAAVFLAATGSKGAILATVMACLLYLGLDRNRIRRGAMALATALAAMTVWLLLIQPIVEYRAAQIWRADDRNGTDVIAITPKATGIEAFTRDFRIGTSSRMTKLANGNTNYTDRPYNIWHTGQRDLLWKAGLATIAQIRGGASAISNGQKSFLSGSIIHSTRHIMDFWRSKARMASLEGCYI